MKKEVIVYEVEVKRPDGKEYEFKVDENGVILELEKTNRNPKESIKWALITQTKK